MHLENVVKSWDNVVCPAYRYVMSAETSLSFIVTGWHNLCGLQDDITVALKLYIVPYLKTGTLSFLYMCCVTSTVSTIIIMIIITLNWTTSMEELLAFLVLFMSYHEGCWLLFAWNSSQLFCLMQTLRWVLAAAQQRDDYLKTFAPLKVMVSGWTCWYCSRYIRRNTVTHAVIRNDGTLLLNCS